MTINLRYYNHYNCILRLRVLARQLHIQLVVISPFVEVHSKYIALIQLYLALL